MTITYHVVPGRIGALNGFHTKLGRQKGQRMWVAPSTGSDPPSPTGKPALLSSHWSESYRFRGTTWLEHKGSALGKTAVAENASGAFRDVGFQLRGARRNSGGWVMSLSEVPSVSKPSVSDAAGKSENSLQRLQRKPWAWLEGINHPGQPAAQPEI